MVTSKRLQNKYLIIHSLLFTETNCGWFSWGFLVMAASKENGQLCIRVVIPRDLSHTGHFSALTKLLTFRFATKIQIMFITNQMMDLINFNRSRRHVTFGRNLN